MVRRWSRVWALALIGLVTLAGGAVQADGTSITAVPYRDTGYRYQVVAHGDGSGFEAVGFDDSGTDWSTGAAGFGTTDGGCWWNSTEYVQTAWPVDTDILVRKTIELPAGAHNLHVLGNIDNKATVYINGVEIGYVSTGWCAENKINFTAPDSLLVAGTNVLAIRGYGDTVYNFLDVQVTYDEPHAPSYAVCPLYDQTKAHKAGSTAPIKLQLCDASGANLSSSAIVVNAASLTKLDGTASAVVEDSGNANPDADFRYDEELGGYVYNLSTQGLSSGTWQLSFTVDGVADPSYAVLFDVR